MGMESNVRDPPYYTEEITWDIFYKPHTILLLFVPFIWLIYSVFTRNAESYDDNLWCGICAAILAFAVISIIFFPHGQFIRYCPAFWRVLFGLSLLYFLFLVFILFQNRSDIRDMLQWLCPEVKYMKPDTKVYDSNCSNITFESIWSKADTYTLSHSAGWALKTMMIRHYGFLWALSILWEVTELAFAPILPVFKECWWDQLILDVLVCNGIGIWIGMKLVKFFGLRPYHWESIINVPTAEGKKRVVLEFKFESFTNVKWLDPTSSYMRVIAIWIFCILCQMHQLNLFFFISIFVIDVGHKLNVVRFLFLNIVIVQVIRQYYGYTTDIEGRDRFTTQVFIHVAIIITELIICIKNGSELFKNVNLVYICIWLIFQFLLAFGCIYLSAFFARREQEKEKKILHGSREDKIAEDTLSDNSDTFSKKYD